jgi:hypothetical protein
LPQTKSNAPVVLSLEGLTEGGRDSWRFIQPKWHVASSDPQWSKARVRSTTFMDASGNEGQWLSPREKAWKVLAAVARKQLGDFSPDEFLLVTNVAIPALGENTYSGPAVDRNGVSITIHAIAGAGEIVSTNGGSWQTATNGFVGHSTSTYSNFRTEKWGSRSSFVLVELKNVQENDDIDFEMRDDAGNEIKLNDSRGYNGKSGGGRVYLVEFTPATEAKALNLAVIVNRPLEFEFMVNPADLKPAPKK